MLAQPPLWLILIAFVCAIGPLVFIHEMGHYLVGRLFGVGAETFSIGFGREVAGWTDRSGTRWKVGWLPLGGYVRFIGDEVHAGEGETDAVEADPRSFAGKPVWQRFLIVLAGPMANFLLAIGIFAAFFLFVGVPGTSNEISRVLPGGAASSTELRAGDRIESVARIPVNSFRELRLIVMLRPGQRVPLEYSRGDQSFETNVTIGEEEIVDQFGQRTKVGLLGVEASASPVPVSQVIPEATRYTIGLTRSMIDGVGQIIVGDRSVKDLGGPLKIAQVAGQQASLGPFHFIQLLALISINLGFINLLPVPVLDGGHLVFYAVEAVRRKPVSVQAQEWAFRGGLAMILALLLFTTVNDLGSFGLWDQLERLIG